MFIFVGNIPFESTQEQIKALFQKFGDVGVVSIRKKSGMNSRGFGFVEMPSHLHAEAAITGLDNKDFMGRALSVSLRRPIIVKKKKKNTKETKNDIEAKSKELLSFDETVPEVKAPKENKPYSGRKGPSPWKKRKGTGKAIAWKKKPGGVKKKFRN